MTDAEALAVLDETIQSHKDEVELNGLVYTDLDALLAARAHFAMRPEAVEGVVLVPFAQTDAGPLLPWTLTTTPPESGGQDAVAWRSKNYGPMFVGGFAWSFITDPESVTAQHEPLYTHPQPSAATLWRRWDAVEEEWCYEYDSRFHEQHPSEWEPLHTQPSTAVVSREDYETLAHIAYDFCAPHYDMDSVPLTVIRDAAMSQGATHDH